MSNVNDLRDQSSWRGYDAMQFCRKLGLTGNLQVALDAGSAASYTSGQSWLDLSGNGQDWFLGTNVSATSTDPTFNGTAGNLSSSEYFSFDGGDYFKYDSAAPAWMETFHKDAAVFTLAGWYYVATNTGYFWSSLSNTGFRHRITGSGAIEFDCYNAGAQGVERGGGTIILNKWVFIAVGITENGGASASYGMVDAAVSTFNANYTTPATGNASGPICIGADNTPGGFFASGGRVAMNWMWDKFRPASEMRALYYATRGRFSV